MKRTLLNFTLLLALFSLMGCKKSTSSNPSAGRVPAAPPFEGGRQTSFGEVTRQLDPGGSLFLYLATDQWLAGLSTNISDFREVLLSMPGPWNENRDDIERAFDVVTHLVQNCGVEDVTGVGLSSAPVAPGLFRNKFILHHANGAGQGFLWSMFGRAPHALSGQDMLPANTALAAFGDLDVAQVWKVLEEELTQSGIGPAVEMARSFPKMFEKQTTIPWAALLASLGGEIGVVLTLDEGAPISIPAGRGSPIELPGPALIIAVKVNNDLLYTHLSTQFKANPKAVTSDEGGLKICSMPMELPVPLPLSPTVASSGDYFYFATSPELVRAVQAVRKGKQPGLKASEEFQALAKLLPAEGNQFFYVSRVFGQTLAEGQRQAMRGTGVGEEQMAFLQRFLGGAQPSYSLAIGAHTATGWQTTSVGNRDSAAAVMLVPAVGATAVGAGMLLPALAKAKARAQSINSVNNLKQLGLAARMYANDHKDKFPKAETWSDDLKEFVGNTKVYKAPNDPGPNPCSYAFNASLSGMDIAKVNPQTVLFFEADGGWNNQGGSELLLPRPRSGGIYIIGLADGSVQQITAGRVRSLRWEP
jgi:hypothetical protein